MLEQYQKRTQKLPKNYCKVRLQKPTQRDSVHCDMSENCHNNMKRRSAVRENHKHKFGQRTLANIDDIENVKLEQAIRELNCFEAMDRGTALDDDRAKAIVYLEDLLGRWCHQVEEKRVSKEPVTPSFAAIVSKNYTAPKPNVWQRAPPSVIGTSSTSLKTTATVALIPFGSYQLGVHSTESDLDLLALAPPTIHRSDFFTSLVKLLQEDEYCNQIHPIASAYTPVIKFVLNLDRELHIDLVFARVANSTKLLEYHSEKSRRKQRGISEPVEYRLDDTDLQDLDEAGVRSLNGARVTQMILEAVSDVSQFQTVLRAVKHWAVVQGIYSNKMGFLGGVNWALLVAWVCKKHPNSSPSYTLRMFFQTFAQWNWNTPVLLNGRIAETPPVTNLSTGARALRLPAWNPSRNPRDGRHVMPIITPAYPSMNSSYNVDQPQLRRIVAEMIRAHNLLVQCKDLRKPNVYKDLFAPSDFFECHKHFLHLKITAENKQDFVEWFRFVESKIRLLINNVETPQVHAWPFARFFSEPKDGLLNTDDSKRSDFTAEMFIGLRFGPDLDRVDIEHLTMDFLYKVNNWDRRNESMDLTLSHIHDEHVPWYVWKAVKPISLEAVKDGSVGTAPATDDDDSIETPNKKCRVLNVSGTNRLTDNLKLL